MGKLKSLLAGLFLGAGGMYVGLQYHLLHAEEGYLIVPRAPQQRMQDAFADIRGWDAATWTARPRVALAVAEHGRSDLITEDVSSGLIDRLRKSFSAAPDQLGQVSQGWEPASTTDHARQEPENSGRGRTAQPPGSSPSVRRGFLPLADLFGLGQTAADQRNVLPAGEDSHITPVLPAGVSRSKRVELLPPPVEFEELDGPGEVDLGPAAPMPGSIHGVDRRRSHAGTGWQPISIQSY